MSKPMLYRIVPFALFIALMALDPILSNAIDKWLDARWLYGVRCVATLLLLIVFWREFEELRWQRINVRDGLLALLTGIAVLVLWVNLDVGWLVIGTAGTGFTALRDGEIDWWLAGMRLAGSALVIPVMEELFWRSFLMRWVVQQNFQNLSPARITWFALLASSFVFGLSHTLWFAGIVAGVAYGLLYRHTGNLWLSVIAHAITNAGLGAWILATRNWQFW